MNDKQYYRAYLTLQKKHEKLSYNIVRRGFKNQFEFASTEYLEQPNTPVDLLVRESDTLDFISKIYINIGIEFAQLVDKSLDKYKSSNLKYSTKAGDPNKPKKPKKEYVPTNQDPKINIWKNEFIRLTQTKEIADKVTKVTNTTKQQIREIIQRGVEEKLSHKQVAKLILQETDSIKSKQRALTIARTENAVGSNKGAIYTANSSGLILYKQWIARSGDLRTRDAHAAMIGTPPIPMNALFNVGGESMAHPCDGYHGAGAGNIVNCRCIISFVPASRVVAQGVNKPNAISISKPKPIQTSIDFQELKPIVDVVENVAKDVFTPAKTVNEAIEYAKQNLSTNVNFDWTKDVNILNRINQTAFDFKNEYQLSSLENLGFKTSRKGALMSANFKVLNINPTIFKTKKSIAKNYLLAKEQKAIIQKNLEYIQKRYEETKDVIWSRRLKQYEEKFKYTNGWTVDYGEEKFLENVMVHEYGHILHDQMLGGLNGIRNISEFRKSKRVYMDAAERLQQEHLANYRKANLNGDIYKISEYGATNDKEFLAESFVMYRNGDTTLPIYMKEFFDKLKELNKLL